MNNERQTENNAEVPVSTDNPDQGKRWQFRRTVIVMSLVFCATIITFMTLYGEDTRLNETIAMGTFGLAISIIGSAVFGAVWDDKNSNKQRNR